MKYGAAAWMAAAETRFQLQNLGTEEISAAPDGYFDQSGICSLPRCRA
jgi:hypothetical protein